MLACMGLREGVLVRILVRAMMLLLLRGIGIVVLAGVDLCNGVRVRVRVRLFLHSSRKAEPMTRPQQLRPRMRARMGRRTAQRRSMGKSKLVLLAEEGRASEVVEELSRAGAGGGRRGCGASRAAEQRG